MSIASRRRAMMAAKSNVPPIEKTVFDITSDKTTTASGGNALEFYNNYFLSQKGLCVFSITGNSTSTGYAQFAAQDNQIDSLDYASNYLARQPNSVPSISGNYDFFLKSGTQITRWFIPKERIDVLPSSQIDIFNVTTDFNGTNVQFYNTYKGTARGVYVFHIAGNTSSSSYKALTAIHDYRTGADYAMFRRSIGYAAGVAPLHPFDFFISAGSVIKKIFIPTEEFA